VCFFVCLALPQKQVALKLEALAPDLELTDATDSPIGKAARGNREQDQAFLITAGGCSCFISEAKMHRTETSSLDELETLIQSLLEYVPTVSMLIHYAHGDISRERVVQKEKRLVQFNEVRGQLRRLEVDIRYVIKGSHGFLRNKPMTE
jgi:hypothetical protein